MIIYDEQMNPLEEYDLTHGHIVTHMRTVEHEAVEAVAEVSHFEVIEEYPNGGKDVRKVIDVPAVPGKEAWTESVEYGVYIPYTSEELAEMEQQRNTPTMEERLASIENALNVLLTGVVE